MDSQGVISGINDDRLLFDYLGSHFVAFCATYVPIDPSGKPLGPEQGYSASGFVIELDDIWYFITAGHVLGENLGDHIAGGRVRLNHCSLADYFGRNAKNHYPTVFSYEGIPKFHVDNWDAGLDIGVLQLGPLYVAGLKSNGVAAISERVWREGDSLNEQQFIVFGLPEEEREPPAKGEVAGYARPCIAGLTPCDLPDGTDSPTHPIFVGQLNSHEPDSMKGFSGGPIFRYRHGPDGMWFWLHAVQSRWRRSSRVVLGCPMTVVAQLIRDRLGSQQP